MRRVTVAEEFFWILDSMLPSQRGGDRPARNDFVRHDLLVIVAYFGEHWDDEGFLLASKSNAKYRRMYSSGRHVSRYEVLGHELSDGSIELTHISFDFVGLLGDNPDEASPDD